MSRVTRGNNGITQKYNVLTHRGVDIGHHNNSDDNILAHSDGVVVAVVSNYNKTDSSGSSYGNYIKIKHENGYFTLYAHLKYKGVYVKVGDKVKQGQYIADMGNTGRSTAKHLHFEVRNTKDVRIDPTPYLNADLPNVVLEYQVYDVKKKKWLPKVKSGKTTYAGNKGNNITGVRISNTEFEVHLKGTKEWIKFKNETSVLPKVIDGIRIKGRTYRTYDNTKKKWLPYVSNDKDYAGNLNNPIGGLQIK